MMPRDSRYGWKRNELGLRRWEVELVHDTSNAALWAIEDRMMRGDSFDDARKAALKRVSLLCKGYSPEIAEGVRRVVNSYTYRDLSAAVHGKHENDFLNTIARARGRPVRWIERILFRFTGLVF